jgi:DNA invertase Pin-like site-specific DNA recombinase
MESAVEFVAADMPFANKIHILAAVAEHEREAISARTRRRSPLPRPEA